MSIGRKSTMGKLRAWIVALAVATVAFGASAAPAWAVPAKFWGVVPQATPTLEQFQRLKRGGVDSVRIPVGWSSVEATQGGPIDWGGVDALVRGASSAGLEVLPFLTGGPRGGRGGADPARRP